MLPKTSSPLTILVLTNISGPSSACNRCFPQGSSIDAGSTLAGNVTSRKFRKMQFFWTFGNRGGISLSLSGKGVLCCLKLLIQSSRCLAVKQRCLAQTFQMQGAERSFDKGLDTAGLLCQHAAA